MVREKPICSGWPCLTCCPRNCLIVAAWALSGAPSSISRGACALPLARLRSSAPPSAAALGLASTGTESICAAGGLAAMAMGERPEMPASKARDNAFLQFMDIPSARRRLDHPAGDRMPLHPLPRCMPRLRSPAWRLRARRHASCPDFVDACRWLAAFTGMAQCGVPAWPSACASGAMQKIVAATGRRSAGGCAKKASPAGAGEAVASCLSVACCRAISDCARWPERTDVFRRGSWALPSGSLPCVKWGFLCNRCATWQRQGLVDSSRAARPGPGNMALRPSAYGFR